MSWDNLRYLQCYVTLYFFICISPHVNYFQNYNDQLSMCYVVVMSITMHLKKSTVKVPVE